MRTSLLPAIACGLIVLATTAWPGDVPWGGDDVQLIATAARFNAAHRLVDAGLGGSFGMAYGPVPAQVYQGLLAISRDLPTVVRLRAILTAGGTAIALLWLARSLGWSPWLAPMAMGSPFFWFYTRLLWDNTFAIPVGAMLLAGYASHLRHGRGPGLLVAAASACVLPLIHPMTLPLLIPVVGHALGFQRAALARRWKGLAVLAVCLAISSGGYLWRSAHEVHFAPPHAGPSPDGYDPLPRPAAFAYPLLAGRLFSAFHFFDDRGPERGLERSAIVNVARVVSAVAFPLVWLGLMSLIRNRAGACRPGPGRHAPALSIGLLCLLALLGQSLLDGLLRVAPYPHYLCGTWAAAVVCLWAGLRSLGRWAVPVGLAYVASLTVCTATFAVDIHHQHGGPVWYGPSLAAQQEAPGVHPGLR